jgi:hypothetical protein
LESDFYILRTLGIPSIVNPDYSIQATNKSLECAAKNKVRLFYLETLNKNGKIGLFEKELDSARIRRQKILQLAVFLGTLFEENSVPYTIMKTLKPFSYEGSDVDILVGSPVAFSKAIKLLITNRFTLLGNDLFSATLYRKDFDANVDLQLELSVSGLPYLHKEAIFSSSTKWLIDGKEVNTLTNTAEALVVAAHCFYKEHMYTIADFYASVLQIKEANVDEITRLAKETHSELALSSLVFWSRKVAFEAFGVKLKGIDSVQNLLGEPALARFLVSQELSFPQKFSQSFTFSVLLEHFLKDKSLRSNTLKAVYTSLSRKQYRALIHHFGRSSY